MGHLLCPIELTVKSSQATKWLMTLTCTQPLNDITACIVCENVRGTLCREREREREREVILIP